MTRVRLVLVLPVVACGLLGCRTGDDLAPRTADTRDADSASLSDAPLEWPLNRIADGRDGDDGVGADAGPAPADWSPRLLTWGTRHFPGDVAVSSEAEERWALDWFKSHGKPRPRIFYDIGFEDRR